MTCSFQICRPLTADAPVDPVEFIGFDITGGKIEYDILASQGPNTTLRKVPTQKYISQTSELHLCCSWT